MTIPRLAPLRPFAAPPAPGTATINPGCTDPANQSYAPAPTDQGGARTRCSSPTVTSNGEMQRGNQHIGNVSSGTVQVSAGSGAVVQASGETLQFIDRRQSTIAVTTGRGLPTDVMAGQVNHARFNPATKAVGSSPAVTVPAGNAQSGGLAVNVNIK